MSDSYVSWVDVLTGRHGMAWSVQLRLYLCNNLLLFNGEFMDKCCVGALQVVFSDVSNFGRTAVIGMRCMRPLFCS